MSRPLVLALALSLAACTRAPGPVHLTSIQMASGSLRDSLREAGIDPSEVEGAARRELSRAGFVIGEGARAHRAELEVLAVRLAPPDASGGLPRVELALQIELSAAPPGRPVTVRETGTGSAPLDGVAPARAWGAALAAAARQAAEGLALAFAAEAKPLAKVIADLSSKDRRIRDHAVRVLAERRSAEAVPALVERLHDEDPKIAQRAIGALAQIGDERAVGPLIDASRTGDPLLAARVARLIGDIGGAEAEGYLLTLESGHPDRRVRVAAGEALAEMAERRRQAGAVSARK